MANGPTFSVATPRMAAGALIRDAAGHVLLVKPTYKEGWDLPGGYVEPGESPAIACSRELQEELGLHRRVDRLLVIDWAPTDGEGDKLLFVFDGGQLASADEVTPDGDEIAEARFHHPGVLASVTPTPLSRRLVAALESAAGSGSVYLEHGAPVTGARGAVS
jgi:8-oxo-dGTP diphosphatase